MKLSVAMITYNQERYISQAIESVLAQRVTFDYEVIIGEDCSTDGTRAVIMDFQRRYPDRIKLLLRDRNIGGFRNLESTLATCRGEYVAILEGDDYWICADKLQRQVDFLDARPDHAICCHRVRFVTETSHTEAHVFPSRPAGSYLIDTLLKENFVMTCSALLRRDLIDPLPPCFSETKIGDWPRCLLATRHRKIGLMDDIMAVYRLHSEGAFSSMPLLDQYEECARMLKMIDRYLGCEYTEMVRQTLVGFYLEMASVTRQQGKRMGTATHVISCLYNGGWQSGRRRLLAGLTAYVLIGSWYKVFSRANLANHEAS